MAFEDSRLFKWLGIDFKSTSHTEKIISAIGAAVGIALVWLVSKTMVKDQAPLVIGSLGASAVLLFAVPKGPLSQPWPLLGGHAISAFIGVTCAQWIPWPGVAAAVAVGLAVGVMYYTRCIHPPGGATSLVAVIGGDAIHELGYQFVLTPVLLSAVIILAVALAFNYPFRWRRYPSAWRGPVAAAAASEGGGLSHDDLVYAFREWDSYLDVSEEDLSTLFNLAYQHGESHHVLSDEIHLGDCFSNGAYGRAWEVRQIVDEYRHANPEKDVVIYKTVAGVNRRHSGTATRDQFARWAKYKVTRNENSWQRVLSSPVH